MMEIRIPTGKAISMETDFFFLGDALALDLVNTEVIVRRKPADLLKTSADLAGWWHIAGTQYGLKAGLSTAITETDFRQTKRLREALRGLFTSVAENRLPSESDLEILNAVLRLCYLQAELLPNGMLAGTQHTDRLHPLLMAVAFSGLELLTGVEYNRLRKCKNEHCILMFRDTTKNARRFWCSPACQNRARSAEHYHQTRES